MNDAFGTELKVGDNIVYAHGGQGSCVLLGYGKIDFLHNILFCIAKIQFLIETFRTFLLEQIIGMH